MMQQKMPWEEDWTQPQSATTGMADYPTITIPRDPRQVAREDAAAVRAAEADRRARENDERDRIRFGERGKPTLPAGYMMGPDGRTAVRIPGLPPEKDASPPASTADLASVRAEALDKIRLARSLQQRSRDGWFTTGFGAGVAGMVGGSPAYDVRQDTETLKNAGALTRIMEMAKTNGGKNPLTPLSNSDFQALASSLSNLETGQSDGQYQANVQRVIDLYTRAYKGAGGADLEGDLDPTTRRREPSLAGMAQAPSTPVIAGGATKSERDPERERALDGLIRSGADMTTLNAKSREMGGSNLDAGQVDQWRAFYAKHPDYRGSSVDTSVSVPTTALNRFTASPLGTGIYATVDAGLGGTSDELASLLGGGDQAEINARKQAAFSANPKSALLGQVVGAVGATAGINRLLPGTTSALRALGIDTVYGGLSGAGQANDNRTLGALVGTAGAAAGNVVGQGVAGVVGAGLRTQPGTALLNRGRGMFFGRPPIASASQPTAADVAALGSLRRAGPDQVTTQLQEAQRLGLPMSLADTGAGPRELLGAAVRHSPEAGGVVEDALIARNRGQYDRFSAAVTRDLGPTTSIPQHSADLTAQARTAASPLYERAYANPVPVTPELDAVLGTPFGRQALGRARTIAANERRSPTELGFGLDDQGNTILNPQPNDLIARHLDARAALDEAQDAYRTARQTVGANVDAARDQVLTAREVERRARAALFGAPDPTMAASMPTYTTQTLDYVKRGMDDVLEEKRNPITGRLQLDEAGRAQNEVRGQLLSEVDRLNPDFAAARAAYAGPVASRDAMIRGVDAYSLPPDELAMQIGNQTPEHLGQMQLGYRSELMDHASRVRDASNPWEATLGSPAARSRMTLLHGDTPGTSNLLRTRDLEAQMQRTSNAVIGNSRTAQRQIADDAFGAGGVGRVAESALHAGAAVATNGASLPGTAARMLGTGIRDRALLGFGRAAERKAEALAPILGNVDPATSLATLEDLIARDAAYQAFRRAITPRRMFGRLGAAGSGQAAVIPVR